MPSLRTLARLRCSEIGDCRPVTPFHPSSPPLDGVVAVRTLGRYRAARHPFRVACA